MTVFSSWLFGIVAASMALSLVYAMVPKGAILSAAKCAGSLILILVMLRPLLSLRAEEFTVSYEKWERELTAQTEDLAAKNLEELEALIEGEVSAYISEKGTQLGLTVHSEVYCEVREGVPFPVEVHLDIPYHGALSQYISQELDISPERQYWLETEEEK
ncbi:MAG: hypothetical protein IKV99_00395 [Oscillospiraceae bacterium]|nr:hypothetical protein [Oscillospiraceae bacterium]